MKFEKLSESVYQTESQSRKGVFHYIALFENPMYEPIVRINVKNLSRGVSQHIQIAKIADRYGVLTTCTCESFRMGIPRGGGNPFIDPCVHVKAFKNRAKKKKKGRKK